MSHPGINQTLNTLRRATETQPQPPNPGQREERGELRAPETEVILAGNRSGESQTSPAEKSLAEIK